MIRLPLAVCFTEDGSFQGFNSHDIGDQAQVQCSKGCKSYSPEKSQLVYLQNTYIQWIPSDLSGGYSAIQLSNYWGQVN